MRDYSEKKFMVCLKFWGKIIIFGDKVDKKVKILYKI